MSKAGPLSVEPYWSGWLLPSKPSPQHHWVTRRPIAHRGLFHPDAGIPENSYAAFRRARDLGLAIELDVRILADGQPVVFHDRELRRMTGQPGYIHDLTAKEIGRLRLLPDDRPPPLLAEVLDLIGDRVGVLVEIKDPTPQAAAAVARVADAHPGPWAALSFHANVIAWFARHRPHVTRGLNGGGFEWDHGLFAAVAKRYFLHLAQAKPHFLGCHHQCLNDPIPRWFRARGLPLVSWTIRSPEMYHTVRPLCDAIIFEGFLVEL
ncbi:MAG: glycerophosphodiester phosphodiesterase [Magnetococcales bacterium]|nr:glycerophosphodiester phosphodiesterase [Magnetococcales bacterium]